MSSVQQKYRFTKEDCQRGFAALVEKRFDGDVEAAKRYVGDLGRASFYYNTRKGHAVRTLAKHQDEIPELFVTDDDDQVIDIAWKSEWLADDFSLVF